MKRTLLSSCILCAILANMAGCNDDSSSVKGNTGDGDAVLYVSNTNGPTLGYSQSSGIKIISVDGGNFKDLNKNNVVDPYEDWRLSIDERATDLASKMSINQIAGLMLYSSHQGVPNKKGSAPYPGTWNGKDFEESGANPWDLTDQQKRFLSDDNLRHILVTTVESPAIAAKWSNKVQAYVEGLGLGIPANNSSDPRHGTTANTEYNAGAGGNISLWPTNLGLAATFDPDLVKNHGKIVAKEYRALGITTALGPQIDLTTEPRWSRFNGSFGEDATLVTDLAKSLVDGMQTSSGTDEIANGWGYTSVNAMIKHWPSGGPEEAGRDAHYAYGQYAVYPGNNFSTHLKPFTEGALNLEDGTSKAAAVMPYYTISYDQSSENVANGFNEYLITTLLRNTYGYDGVLCTDWGITKDVQGINVFSGRSYGVEGLNVNERHYKALMAGMDQFGGNDESAPVVAAYSMMVASHGEVWARERFEASAKRLLKNMFRVGLFENPYLDEAKTTETVGKAEYMKAGYEAQIKSIVMLKNSNNSILPIDVGSTTKKKAYVPKKYTPASVDWYGNPVAASEAYPIDIEIVKKYFDVVDTPVDADIALAFISSPEGGSGYSSDDVAKGGNGYVPISLQYKAYTATTARAQSLAAGNPLEVGTPAETNRSYKDKTVTASNTTDMDMVVKTKEAMGNKPVITFIDVNNPMVMSEIEPYSDAILVGFGEQAQAFLDIVMGAYEPSGLLPLQMPIDMVTVESQNEDIGLDMTPYTDAAGNKYDFAFGLNWAGKISDARTAKYSK